MFLNWFEVEAQWHLDVQEMRHPSASSLRLFAIPSASTLRLLVRQKNPSSWFVGQVRADEEDAAVQFNREQRERLACVALSAITRFAAR